MSDASNDKAKPTRKRRKKSSPAGRTSQPEGEVAKQTANSEQFTGPEKIYDFADSVVEDDVNKTAAEAVAARLETWVTFRLAGEVFALPVTAAREILRVSTITRVPHAPHTVRGIINMRGRVVPVVDFRVRLGLPEATVSPKSRILITSTRNRLLGLLVDEVEQVLSLDLNAVTPAPSDVMTERSEYIIGVCHLDNRLLILLDVERVLLVPDSLEDRGRAGS